MTIDDLNPAAENRFRSNPWAVVIPMTVILILLVGFFWAAQYLAYCAVFPFVKFVYPLIFGTAGIVLGGQISIKGTFSQQFPWAISASAGIAAALVGFGIAASSEKPTCGGPTQYKLIITDLPAISPRSMPASIVVPNYETNIGAMVTRANSDTKDLQFTFDASGRFTLQLYVLKLNDQKEYKYLATCNIQFEVAAPNGNGTTFTIAKDGATPSFMFDESYLQRIIETSKNGSKSAVENACLTAQLTNGNGKREVIDGPFFIQARTAGGPTISFVRDDKTKLTKVIDGQADPDLDVKNPIITKKIESPPTVNTAKESLDPKLLEKLEAKKSAQIATIAPTVTLPTTITAPRSTQSSVAKEIGLTTEACTNESTDRETIDSFVGGNDLDLQTRKQIYAEWNEVHCYTMSILTNANRPPMQRGRALKLLTYGLANADNRIWQPGGKTYRDFSKPLPYLRAEEIDLIFRLVKADDDVLREQALRFARTLPADSLERLFRFAALTLDRLPQPEKERLAVGASFLYYNRIVEYLNDNGTVAAAAAEKRMIRTGISNNTVPALEWANDALFTTKNAKPYRALIEYAQGIVEREKKLTPDLGKSHFTTLLDTLRDSADGYPTNYLHVAQALAIVEGNEQTQSILERIKKAEWYAPAVFFEESGNTGLLVDLFAGPGEFPKLRGQLKLGKNIRLLMQTGEWDLVHGGGRIGWMRRLQTTASR